MTRLKLGTAIGALLAGLSITSPANAGFSLVASAPKTFDGKTTVSVVVLNEEPGAQTYHAPDIIRATASDGPVELWLASSQREHLLQSGQFLRVNYVTSRVLPAGVSVRFDAADAAPQPARSSETATVSPAAQPTTSSDTMLAVSATQPVKVERSLVETLGFRLKAHEPVYFLVGPDFPNAKFQFSMKYHLIGDDEDSPENIKAKQEKKPSVLSGVYLAYSQTSFWDLEGFSKPFFDSSYRPEIFYQFDGVERNIEEWTGWNISDNLAITLQAGLKHESNGRSDTPTIINRDGEDELDEHPSRSLNIAYLRAIFNYQFADDLILKISPSIHAYVLGMDDINDDIAEYRGYGDLKVVFGKKRGLQLAATGRIGSEFDKGSIQLDLSFPISEFRVKDFDIYFHTQYFNGYGETLHDFDINDSSLRVGISMVR